MTMPDIPSCRKCGKDLVLHRKQIIDVITGPQGSELDERFTYICPYMLTTLGRLFGSEHDMRTFDQHGEEYDC